MIGAVEPVSFPVLGLERIFAKIDSGADFSTLHALHPCLVANGREIEFTPPLWRTQPSPDEWRSDGLRRVRAPLLERRNIRNSAGEEEERYVIETPMLVGGLRLTTSLTLTARTGMRYPALVGRLALASSLTPIHIDPAAENLTWDR